MTKFTIQSFTTHVRSVLDMAKVGIITFPREKMFCIGDEFITEHEYGLRR